MEVDTLDEVKAKFKHGDEAKYTMYVGNMKWNCVLSPKKMDGREAEKLPADERFAHQLCLSKKEKKSAV